MKDTYYFPHDYNARNDPKLLKLQMRHGYEGKGIYWDLIESLYEQNGYMELDSIEAIAFNMKVAPELLRSIITDFSLFESDKTRFWSDSALRRLEERQDKSEMARKSAKKRWQNETKTQEGCERNANAMRTQCDSGTNALRVPEGRNALKERKGEESKGKEIKGEESKKEVAATPAAATPENSDPENPSVADNENFINGLFIACFNRNPNLSEQQTTENFLKEYSPVVIRRAFYRAREALSENINLAYIRGILDRSGNKIENIGGEFGKHKTNNGKSWYNGRGNEYESGTRGRNVDEPLPEPTVIE